METVAQEAVHFQLVGIEVERQKTIKRLQDLEAYEKELRASGLTSTKTPRTAKAPKADGATKRKRSPMSAEQKKKMSDAGKARWAKRNAAKAAAAGAQPVEQPTAETPVTGDQQPSA